MYYRCRDCQHEAAFGFLPSATSGLYALALLTPSVGCAALVLTAVGVPPSPVPWWVGVLIVVALVLPPANHLALATIEYLAVCRTACPACGGRRWSRGYTRGFGP